MQYYDSLHTIPLDKISDMVGGRSRLTFLVSNRLRMINDGAPLLVERLENEALLATVCREVEQGKIWLEDLDTLDTSHDTESDLDNILGSIEEPQA